MSLYDETYQCWGIKSQIHKFSEELGELLVAMHHWYDDKATHHDLAEEIADVEIVCGQLRNLINDNPLVNEFKMAKLKNLRKKVDECLTKQKPWTVQGTQWNATPSGTLQSMWESPKNILNCNFIRNILSRITKSWDVQEKE